MKEAEKRGQKDPILIIDQKRRRRKIGIGAGSTLFVTAAAIGLINFCGDGQAQGPIVDSTPTPAVTQVPELILSTATPQPTETQKPTTIPPTPTKYPWQLLTPEPFPTRAPVPTKTPEPKPTSTPIPTPTLDPTPTHVPTVTPISAPIPAPSPTPEVPTSELRVGDPPLNFTRCFVNGLEDPKKRSVEFGSIGLQTTEKIYDGNKKFIDVEITVPKTQEEIKRETEIARKKAIREGKDPNTIVIERKKIVSEGKTFDVDPGTTCIDLKVSAQNGSSLDCYRAFTMNYKTREGSPRIDILKPSTLLERFCTGGVLKGSILSYDYNSVTNTGTVVVKIENPAKKTSQQTKFKMEKPCSFLEFAEQEIQIGGTNSTIFPNEPQTIPAGETILYAWKFVYPDGRQPTLPLHCTLGLSPIIPKK